MFFKQAHNLKRKRNQSLSYYPMKTGRYEAI